ncbi:MAG: cell division protein FtsA [Limnochordia bacterium]
MSTIFALDIGTRKIAGLLMEQEGQKYIVHHVVIKEQLPNAMQDGQIHDIPKVAQTIREVVAEISAYTSLQITEAVVAAAGRSLRTQRGQSTIRLPLNQEITGDMLGRLELSGPGRSRQHESVQGADSCRHIPVCRLFGGPELSR